MKWWPLSRKTWWCNLVFKRNLNIINSYYCWAPSCTLFFCDYFSEIIGCREKQNKQQQKPCNLKAPNLNKSSGKHQLSMIEFNLKKWHQRLWDITTVMKAFLKHTYTQKQPGRKCPDDFACDLPHTLIWAVAQTFHWTWVTDFCWKNLKWFQFKTRIIINSFAIKNYQFRLSRR